MPNDWPVGATQGRKATNDSGRALARLAGQWGVVSRAELDALGLSDKEVRTLVRRGHLHPLHRGVDAVGHRNITTEGRFLAAVKACGPDADHAAACHHGRLRYAGRPVDVTAPTKRRRPRITTHRSDAIERVLVRRIPTTPRIRTIIDLARVEEERVVTRALRQAKLTEAEVDRLPRTGLLAEDRRRQAWLESVGERVLRTTKLEVTDDPARFFARLSAAGAPYTRSAQTQL